LIERVFFLLVQGQWQRRGPRDLVPVLVHVLAHLLVPLHHDQHQSHLVVIPHPLPHRGLHQEAVLLADLRLVVDPLYEEEEHHQEEIGHHVGEKIRTEENPEEETEIIEIETGRIGIETGTEIHLETEHEKIQLKKIKIYTQTTKTKTKRKRRAVVPHHLLQSTLSK